MRIKIGYFREIYVKYGALAEATIRSEGSTLISGGTGSGKSTLLWFLLYSYICSLYEYSNECGFWNKHSDEALVLDICDYKREFRALYGCPRYHYEIEDIVTAIDRFFQAFQNVRENTDRCEHHCMVIDEYFSFISFLEAMAKTNKEYKEMYQRVLMEIRSILAMGRSLGFTLICIVQQAASSSFSSSGDRENFINKIAMGTQSSISASMIFDTTDTSDIDYKKPIPAGSGFLAVQAEPVREIIVPRIKNPDVMQSRIRAFLDSVAYPGI